MTPGWALALVEDLAVCDNPLERFVAGLEAHFPHQGGSAWFEGQRLASWGHGAAESTFPLAGGGELRLTRPENAELARLLAGVLALALARTRMEASLEEARGRLLESSRLKMVGQLAAGVAHELATPLSAMIISTQSALQALAVNPTKAAPRLERAWKAAEQARRIAEKLLTSARPPSRESAPILLPELIEETLEIFAVPWRQQGAQLIVDFHPVPPIIGRAGELQQVLVNLIQNAVQASLRCPDRRILIGCQREAGEAVLRVTDHGAGIAAEHLAKIFDPFFTTKPIGEGTGLGLAVTRQLVEQHGGRLEVSSPAGEGATFRVVLPLPVARRTHGYRESAPNQANPAVP